MLRSPPPRPPRCGAQLLLCLCLVVGCRTWFVRNLVDLVIDIEPIPIGKEDPPPPHVSSGGVCVCVCKLLLCPCTLYT